MTDDKSNSAAASTAAPSAGTPGLALSTQKRNIRIYAALTSLSYLTAPVLYVGFVQAALCKRLDTSDTIANLPTTLYLSMAWFPVVVAWLFPQARLLRPLLSLGYGVIAILGAMVAAVLAFQAPVPLILGALMLHALLLGAANVVTVTLNWEALSRGVAESARGKAFALAFGWGPGYAVVGSLGAQLLLEGNLLGWHPQGGVGIPYPYNYALLFAVSAVTMGLASYLARQYQLPAPAAESARENFRTAVLGGLRDLLSQRILLFACVAYLLVFCGNMIQVNMSIFTFEAIGRPAEELAGYQLALRFSCKMAAGFLLGWLLILTNPKIPLLVTVGLQIAGVLWVLFVPGYWFLLAFAINGAGELFGVYYINYPASCSPKSQVRRNIAFLMMISSCVALTPVFYGWVSDTWSLRASFWSALVVLIGATALVAFKLPARPKPRDEDLLESDITEIRA